MPHPARVFNDVWYFSSRNIRDIIRVLAPFCGIMLSISFTEIFFPETFTNPVFAISAFVLINPYFMCKLIQLLDARTKKRAFDPAVSMSIWARMVMMYFVQGLMAVVGLLAFILPGFLVMAKFSFAEFHVVLNNAQPIESLKTSWSQTEGKTTLLIAAWVAITGFTFLLDWLLMPISLMGVVGAIVASVVTEVLSVSLTAFTTIFFFRLYTLTIVSADERD